MASSPGSRTAGFIASPPAVSRPCGPPFASVVSTFPAPSGKPKPHETSALMSIPGKELHIGELVIGAGFPEPVAGNLRHVTEPRFRLAPAALPLFQGVGHVVEGPREFREFAAGRERSPDGKIAPAKPCRRL